MKPAPDCVFVVVGATGDLAKRKLFPALAALHRRKLLGERTAIIGCTRRGFADDEMRDLVRDALDDVPGGFLDRVHAGSVDLDRPTDESFQDLAEQIRSIDRSGNVAIHLSIPPSRFAAAADGIRGAGLDRGDGWRRLIVEKPFGWDEPSARELDERLRGAFDEEQIYRIDHFLGKDPVQNLFVFRAMNAGHEAVWNAQHIDHVQITVAEELGIGTRGRFYEATGVVRDMLQNHLMQLLCLTAMDLPERFESGQMHAKMRAVLEAVRPPSAPDDIVLGQYSAGTIDGEDVAGYRDEDRVDPESGVPTFVAARFEVDHSRWRGVPFYLRTGKRMARDVGEIVLRFRATHCPFGDEENPCPGNQLVFRLKPDPGIARTFWAKVPGHEERFQQVEMCYAQAAAFHVTDPPDAYEHLLFDALHGDRMLFPRAEEVYAQWRAVEPVLDAAAKRSPRDYRAGTWGPAEADALLAADGRSWHSGAAHATHGILMPAPV